MKKYVFPLAAPPLFALCPPPAFARGGQIEISAPEEPAAMSEDPGRSFVPTEDGGHVGYAVGPSERRRGYATQILKMALAHAKGIGLSGIMLGRYSDDLFSIKTIEKRGGVLTETKPYVYGKPMDVYRTRWTVDF